MPRQRHPDIDVAVGKQIQKARLLVGMTQAELGHKLDVTYYQVQKYEGGQDSLSVGTLIHIAAFLQCPITTLLDVDGASDIPDSLSEMRQAMKLGRVLLSIPEGRPRRHIISLAESLVPTEAAPPPALAAE